MPSEKSKGENESEQKLAKLCEKTFLSMWSYPNVFKDTNKRGNPEAIGQEICDLLVVFDRYIVIFSDKDCGYKNTDNITVDWPRWFRRAIHKSSSTACGAENWIRKNPSKIFIDKQCKVKLPVPIPDIKDAIFIKIVIAHSAENACKEYYASNGALGINTMLCGLEEHARLPFFTGRVLEDREKFVHILDDATFTHILTSLDTVGDFCKYFSRKEYCIQNGTEIIADNELDILAHHFQNPSDSQKDSFGLDGDGLIIEPGNWKSFIESDGWKNKLREDRQSYYWDHLIETFYKYHIAGELTQLPDANPDDIELALRQLASLDRLKRRMLSKAFLDLIQNGMKGGNGGFRTVKPGSDKEPCYVLGAIEFDESYKDYDQYKIFRLGLLSENIIRQAYLVRDDRLYIGIITELGNPKKRSEDIFAFKWNDSFSEMGKKLNEEYLAANKHYKRRVYNVHVDQFPANPNRSAKIGRNDPCPCNSGKKFKHCCIALKK